MVDAVSPYFATAMDRDQLPPIQQAILRAWWLGAAQAAGGTLQVARPASAPPGRIAPDPAAEESDLTGVQVAELAKQNLSSAGALALSVSLLTGYVVTAMDLESGTWRAGDRPSRARSTAGTCGQSSACDRPKTTRAASTTPSNLASGARSSSISATLARTTERGTCWPRPHSSSSFRRDWPRSRRTSSSSPTSSGFFRKYPGRGLPELPLDRSLRDDVYREHERGTESFKKQLAELTKRVTKAEEASAEAQLAAAEAKRSSKSTAKTCFWCGEEGHVKPDCPVFKADLPKVKKGN